MAASPSQQTHWLKLRVDLGLQRLSGMDPALDLDPLSPPSLLGDALSVHQTDGRGRAVHFSLCGSECALH